MLASVTAAPVGDGLLVAVSELEPSPSVVVAVSSELLEEEVRDRVARLRVVLRLAVMLPVPETPPDGAAVPTGALLVVTVVFDALAELVAVAVAEPEPEDDEPELELPPVKVISPE